MGVVEFINVNKDKVRGELLPFAIVGIVDIVASSKITNAITLEADWQIKEHFIAAAHLRAEQNSIQILNHTGDGFLFMVNTEERNWQECLMNFHFSLTKDFQEVLLRVGIQELGIVSGLRFGVSAGAVILGNLANMTAHRTVIGSDVNLAARLCSLADVDGMVVSSLVWCGLTERYSGLAEICTEMTTLKGFAGEVNSYRVRPQAKDQILESKSTAGFPKTCKSLGLVSGIATAA